MATNFDCLFNSKDCLIFMRTIRNNDNNTIFMPLFLELNINENLL